jgi:Lrp/AsnC family transcriptional regulator for asnA, asnC and gidA
MTIHQDCALDELDIRIVKRLTQNGRRRFTDLAEELNVSHGTIRNRYQRMQAEHSLKIACWLDPQRVGFYGGAQVRLSVEAPYLQDATDLVAVFPEITWLGQTQGEFNLMGDVFCRDIQQLNHFLSQRLRAIPRLWHMEVGLYSRIHKVTTLPSLELLECAPHGLAVTGNNSLVEQPSGAISAERVSTDSLLDELDIAILCHLSVDGRRPFTEIAEEVGISHGTVRNRYRQMLESNALKIVCWLDPGQVGFHAVAHMDLSIEVPHLEEAIAQIASYPEVTWLVRVMGEFNLMADVMCLDLACLDDLVSRRLAKLPGIRHMEVATYSEIAKISTMPNLELLDRVTSGE